MKLLMFFAFSARYTRLGIVGASLVRVAQAGASQK
jgi:hypothetical protein